MAAQSKNQSQTGRTNGPGKGAVTSYFEHNPLAMRIQKTRDATLNETNQRHEVLVPKKIYAPGNTIDHKYRLFTQMCENRWGNNEFLEVLEDVKPKMIRRQVKKAKARVPFEI
jgi:hypothetical protein